jgi:thiosulfate reductase cytochrome b subunit
MNSPLYSFHERFWHWLQAVAILFLITSGFAIHYPDRFGILGSMATVLRWHSGIGWALAINAFLGIFYHVTADKYRHFLPRVDDFTEAAVRQVRFYVYGVFKGESHPLETDPRRKLNPLQKFTYLILLNILLPVQILTGVSLWGAERWPQLFHKVGGFWVLGPMHTLCAYLFLAFLVGHIYLATTGPTPGALLRAITFGYEAAESPGTHLWSEAVFASGKPDARKAYAPNEGSNTEPAGGEGGM